MSSSTIPFQARRTFMEHYSRCSDILNASTIKLTPQLSLELYSVLYVVSDFAAFGCGNNRKIISEALLSKIITNISMVEPQFTSDLFKKRVLFYTQVVGDLELHAHALMGKDVSEAHPVIRCCIAFSDCCLYNAYIGNYNAPRPMLSALDVADFSLDVMEPLNSAFASLFSCIREIAKHVSDNPQTASSPKTVSPPAPPVATSAKSPPADTSGANGHSPSRWPIGVIVVLSLLSLALASVLFYQGGHYRSESAVLNSRNAKLEKQLFEQSEVIREQASDISKQASEISSLTVKADRFDAVREFLSSGNAGYSSNNFCVDQSIIVVSKNDTDRKFTLTAHWEGGGTVSYAYDSILSVRPATISFDSSSWKTSTTVSILPKYEGVVIVTFENDVNSETFRILIIVTE